MRPPATRFSNTETRRAGNMMEDVMDEEEVWIEPVLSDSGVVGEDMLDLISLESINVKNVKNSLKISIKYRPHFITHFNSLDEASIFC